MRLRSATRAAAAAARNDEGILDTTQNAAIESEIPSVNNTNDGASEIAPVAPPKKRARVSKESQKDGSKPCGGRRGMAGKLQNIMLMPIDVFAEIAKMLDPFDLLHLSWASRELRAIIMTRNARHMWIGSFKNLPLIPKCPSTMNEPQLAAILFDPVCSNKGCDRRVLKPTGLFMSRLCQPHKRERLISASEAEAKLAPLGYPYYKKVDPNFAPWRMMRTCYEGNFSYLDDDLQSLVTELETLRKNKKPGESLAHSIKELLEQRKPRIDSLIKEGRELEVWHDVYKANLKYDRAGKEDDRADEIENRLQELGWSNEDISAPHRAPEFEKMLIQPTALSESIWRRIRPRLEEILSERKELRLAEEAREEREIREKSIIKGLQMIAKLEATRLFDPLHPTCPTPLWVEQSFAYGASHLPGGLSSLPSLLPLMELSIGPLVDGFGKAYGQIREDLRRTQKKARHSLAQLIRDAESGTPSDDAWAFGEADLADDELDAVDAENLELLLRPSSLFCVPCHHKTVGYKLVGYPRVLRYAAHLDHHTTVGRLAKMLPVASAMMVAFDLEAESQITLSYEDLRFSCGSCPEHVGCTYSWARLVEHYIQEQDWFHIQEEQNLARGVPWFNPHQSYRAKRLDGYEQAIEYLTEVEYRYTKDKSAPIWGCTLCPKRSTHGDPRFCAETVFLAQFPMKKEALLSHLLKRHHIKKRAKQYMRICSPDPDNSSNESESSSDSGSEFGEGSSSRSLTPFSESDWDGDDDDDEDEDDDEDDDILMASLLAYQTMMSTNLLLASSLYL